MSVNDITGFNRDEFDKFFFKLDQVDEQIQIPANTKMFNVYESGISSVQKPSAIKALKGQKQV